jgi:ABC-type uncharacterized transport system YnjBCD substrate-binding protein
MLTAHFKSDYWSEKLLKWKYSVKLWAVMLKVKTNSIKGQKAVHCIYDSNFHLMVSTLLALCHGNSMLQNRMYDTRDNWKYCVIEGSQQNLKSNFLGPKQGNFSAIHERILEFVLEKQKNCLITSETVKWTALEVTASPGTPFIPVLPVLWVL